MMLNLTANPLDATVEDDGWELLPHLHGPAGELVYYKGYGLTPVFAVSWHGWDLRVLSQAELKAIVAAAEPVPAPPYATEAPLSSRQAVVQALDVMREMFGPVPTEKL